MRRNEEAFGKCLVAYRPGIGIMAVALSSIDEVARYAEAWTMWLDPEQKANVQFWIDPRTLPVFAGTAVMDAEQKAFIAEREAKRGH